MENPITKFLTPDKSVFIGEDDWTELNEKYTKEQIIDFFVEEVFKGNIEIPKRLLTEDDAIHSYTKLVNYVCNDVIEDPECVTRQEYRYPITLKYIDEPILGNNASDYFQQDNRFKCSGKSTPSPEDSWKDERAVRSMLSALWSLKYEYVSRAVLVRLIALRRYIAAQFKPTIAKSIYEKCNSRDVLDFSAGWGDRLCGFYAAKCTKSYIGIDPNTAVYNKYFEQAELYSKINGPKKVTFINKPAEDVEIEPEIVDTIFTSPPYFNAEHYCEQENQSWKRYEGLDAWLHGFMYPTLDMCWKALKPNGYLIINISDIILNGERMDICDKMNDYIKSLGGYYVEGLGMKMAKRPKCGIEEEGAFIEPIWVWQKSTELVGENPFKVVKRVEELW